MKNNFQLPKPKQVQIIDIEQGKKELALGDITKQVDMIHREYAEYRKQKIYEALEAQSEEAKSQFMKEFLKFAEPTIQTVLSVQSKRYKRENVLEAPQIKAIMRSYALSELDISNIISMEEFVAQLAEHKRDAWQKLKSYDPDHHLLRLEDDNGYSNTTNTRNS